MTVFSSQNTYRRTVKTAGAACFLLLILILAIFAGFFLFNEDCPYGYHEQYLYIQESGQNDWLSFIEKNVCTPCKVTNCADCTSDGGT